MPILKYLVDTNVVSDGMRGETAVDWMDEYEVEVAISSLSIAELRRGIESKAGGKARRELEREFGFVMEFFEDAVWLNPLAREGPPSHGCAHHKCFFAKARPEPDFKYRSKAMARA